LRRIPVPKLRSAKRGGSDLERERETMSITAHGRTVGDAGTMGRLPMLVPPLAALLYPFALEGFHTSVTHFASSASTLSWLSAAACLALAFAMPLISSCAEPNICSPCSPRCPSPRSIVRLWRNCAQSARPCLP